MKFKKFMALTLTVLMLVGIFTACAPKSTATDTPEATPEPTQEVQRPAWMDEKITLKLASWEDSKIVDGLIKGFMEKYPNVTVVKDESITWPWTDALTNAASAGNLPDVFMLENVPTAVQNDWVYDVSEFWNKDEEAKSVYANMAKAAVYNGKRFAVPTAQFIMGVFVNKTILEKNNIPMPGYDWTFDQMIDIAKKVSKPDEYVFGLCGPWGNLAFDEFLPMLNDASIGYNTFDGEKFNFNNQNWIDGYNLKIELTKTKVNEKMTGEEKKKVFGDEGAWPTSKGNVAFSIDGSWNLGWLPGELEKAGAGVMDFYPYPAGKAGQRMPVIMDFAGMSSTTQHPEAAYELLKYISYGKDGWLNRIKIYKENNMDVTAFPIASYEDVWAEIPALIKTEGAKAAVKLLDQAVPDINKWVPGWNEYNAWLGEQKINDKMLSGEVSPADMAQQLQDKANEFVTKGFESLK